MKTLLTTFLLFLSTLSFSQTTYNYVVFEDSVIEAKTTVLFSNDYTVMNHITFTGGVFTYDIVPESVFQGDYTDNNGEKVYYVAFVAKCRQNSLIIKFTFVYDLICKMEYEDGSEMSLRKYGY